MKATACVEFDFYLATKHYAVHYFHAILGLPPRGIAEQMGWTLLRRSRWAVAFRRFQQRASDRAARGRECVEWQEAFRGVTPSWLLRNRSSLCLCVSR